MAQQGLPAIGEEVPQSRQLTPPANQPTATPATKLPAIGEEVPPSFNAPNATAQPAAPPATWGQTAVDLAKGFAKGAVRTVQFAGDDVPHFFGAAGLGDYMDLLTGQPSGTAYQAVKQGATPTNLTQRAGGWLESGTELAIPMIKGAQALPTAAKAAPLFEDVMSAAKNFPVTPSPETMQVAQRTLDLVEAHHRLPEAAAGFIDDITGTKPFTYYKARDVMGALRKLTTQESMGTTDAMAAQVHQMYETLSKDVAQAAQAAGKGKEYMEAMNMYAQAMRNRAMATALAKKTAIGALILGGGEYAAGQVPAWYQKVKTWLGAP